MNTNLNHYRAFIAVYETKSARIAAEILNTTQPAISLSIKELSRQTGINLFTPNFKGVEPTSEAIALYPIIKNCLDSIREGEESVRNFTEESKAVIRFGLSSSLASIFTPYLKDFCNRYPKVKLELYDKESLELLEMQKIDFIINTSHPLVQRGLEIKPLFKQNQIFVASKEFHKQHNIGKEISIKKFLELPLIGYRSKLNGIQHEGFLEGILPFIETTSVQTAHTLTKNGMGASCFHDKLFHAMKDKDLEQIHVKGVSLPEVKIVCAYHNKANLTKAAQTFIDGLAKFCEKL